MRAPFKDVIKRDREPAAALPVDEFLGELDAFIEAHNPYRGRILRCEVTSEHPSAAAGRPS